MKTLFTQFNGIEVFFLVCALVGGIFVVVRLVMQFMGIDHDADGDYGTGGHDFDSHHADSDVGFKILSLHGLTSFLMMFGLVGLALYRQSKTGTFISIVGAIVGGLVSVWIIKVYLTIPKDGTGRVLVNVSNSLREYDATSNDDEEIVSDTPVRVVWVDGNVLVVERI